MEMMLKEVVLALRAEDGEGNITLRIPETGDLIAVLQVDDDQAAALSEMLRRNR